MYIKFEFIIYITTASLVSKKFETIKLLQTKSTHDTMLLYAFTCEFKALILPYLTLFTYCRIKS